MLKLSFTKKKEIKKSILHLVNGVTGPILTATLPDKQHSLWLHGNTLLKPMHSVTAPNANLASEYAEVTQIMPKMNPMSAPPEPYATVQSIIFRSNLISFFIKFSILFNAGNFAAKWHPIR